MAFSCRRIRAGKNRIRSCIHWPSAVTGALASPDKSLAISTRILARRSGYSMASLGLGWVGEAYFPRLYSLHTGGLFMSSPRPCAIISFALGFSALTFCISARATRPKNGPRSEAAGESRFGWAAAPLVFSPLSFQLAAESSANGFCASGMNR